MPRLIPAAFAAVAVGCLLTAALPDLPLALLAQTPVSAPAPSQPSASLRTAVPTDPRAGDVATTIVRGRVVEAGTGAPVPGARVFGGLVHRSPDDAVLTDASGAFELQGVPAGSALISASKPGFCGSRGQPSAHRRVIVRPGVAPQGVEVVLHRLSAISGRVLDQAGEPVVGAHVTVHRRSRDDAQAYELAGSSVQTDDLGRYRVHSLATGEYLVGARPLVSMRPERAPRAEVAGARERAVPTYHPSATSVTAASWVGVSGGAEATADITLRTATPGRITGTVVDRDGAPVAAGTVNLRGGHDSPAAHNWSAGFGVGTDGRFAITDVPPGSYRLVALSRSFETDAAEADVVVEPGEDEVVVLRMTPGATVRGRLRLDGAGGEDLAGLEVRATALERDRFRFNQVRAKVGADGGFQLQGLRGSVRFDVGPIMPKAPTDAWRRSMADPSRVWRVRQVLLNGRELAGNALDSDDPSALGDIELVAARDFASMRGTVVAPPGVDVGSLVVVAVPVDADRIVHTWPWRNAWTAPSSPDGRFLLQALPPGDYHVFALQQPDDGPAPLDSESLARWRAGATRVTLAASQAVELELRGMRLP